MIETLLAPSPLPFAAPPFDRIDPAAYLPAIRQGIAEAAADIAAIVEDPAPPSFDNTIVALERAGARLARARRIFWTVSSAQADETIHAIEAEIGALLTAHGTSIGHNPDLFARVKSVWEARDTAGLNNAQARLLEHGYRGFVDGGALLDAADKARFAAIATELSSLGTLFGQNVMAAAADWHLLLDPADLDGLPQALRESSARRAEARGDRGKHLITLDRGDAENFLTFSTRRDLRETLWRAFTTRCDGGAHDNRDIVDRMLALRRERAALLGYKSHADYALVDSMAKTPDAAEALLMRVWTPALAQVAAEQAELQAVARSDGQTAEIAPWDWRFYAERVRRDRYALDGAEVKTYLTLDRVRAAAFDCAARLYGLTFERRQDLPGWHPDVDAWAVSRNGATIGLLYTDYLARPEKHGGAWMGSLRVQEKIDAPVVPPVLPITYLVANFAKAPPGADTALSISEARTLFHEFGHALHALLSDVTYPSQAGTAVARDFVEFPSKFMEHWIVAPDTLARLGMPADLIAAIGQADDFGQGFATIELVASSLLDLAVHRSTEAAPDSAAITRATLDRIAMPAAIAPRHGLTHFTHIFDGGYAGAYYSYLWAEVLDADAFAAFEDIFDPALADRFRREILAPGNSRDPLASFIAFRGRPPEEAPLLRDRRLA
ncbi:M3 family metallopeptidase [Sphingomonas hylomeconis]|uniref:M3 family metallopeptidase n=1 Tax=Sphingomonas hylomeconis TaxID=1395958 RepID=A0ABV7SSU6_9SPHN|nr:M3 family metallopeptidase [Sphingomonas hylomeconis]